MNPGAVFEILRIDEGKVFGPMGFYTSALGWKGDEFQFQVFFSLEPATPDGDLRDREAVVGWHLDTGTLRAVPEAEQLPPPESGVDR